MSKIVVATTDSIQATKTSGMPNESFGMSQRAWLLVLLSLFLLLRLDGAHVRLCFDKQGLSASVHVFHLEVHKSPDGFSGEHYDEELALPAQAASKSGRNNIEHSPALLAALLLLVLLLTPRRLLFASHVLATCVTSQTLLPPSRGPPQVFSP